LAKKIFDMKVHVHAQSFPIISGFFEYSGTSSVHDSRFLNYGSLMDTIFWIFDGRTMIRIDGHVTCAVNDALRGDVKARRSHRHRSALTLHIFMEKITLEDKNLTLWSTSAIQL
jgi:hypothetical protein